MLPRGNFGQLDGLHFPTWQPRHSAYGQSHHVVQDTYGYYAHTNHGKNVSSAVGGGGRLALADIPNQELATMIREHRFRFLEEGAPAIGEEDASSESDDSDSESNSDD